MSATVLRGRSRLGFLADALGAALGAAFAAGAARFAFLATLRTVAFGLGRAFRAFFAAFLEAFFGAFRADFFTPFRRAALGAAFFLPLLAGRAGFLRAMAKSFPAFLTVCAK
ncbi:MAG: hypothetical protein A3J29_07425 [Acidobacteria bacterium RIFCSPLOWO2_12_FULL_67_14b]|nr:MAG: hypothetical protein A3J29_07425 [Acidobacteria bacterium RIFCSPLOWO2_12_FULL_67_14b]